MLTLTRTAAGRPRPIRVTRGDRRADAIIGYQLAQYVDAGRMTAKGGA